MKNVKKYILLTGIFMNNIYLNNIILITDPKVLSIQIIECGEKLIDISNIIDENKKIAYGPSPEVPDNKCYTKIRKSVYEKLLLVNKLLEKYGVEICLYEGLRDLDLQKMLFDNIYNKIKEKNPFLLHEEIFIEATKEVSPVINLDGTKNVPAHSTGGAIDVYLIYKDNTLVDIGSHPQDPFIENISATNSIDISLEAQEWRRIMGDALKKAGFINYPTEYWHWSYGDRYWAYLSNNEFAIYDGIEK